MAEEASEPRNLTPFKIIHRGEDTLGPDDEVQFADFSPRMIPADVPDEVVVAVPKEESAPQPVPSSESTETTEPAKSETSAQTPADEDAGKPSPNGSGKQTSSSAKKTG